MMSASSLTACLLFFVARANALSLGSAPPPQSKGLTHVALVELGSGCCHGDNPTKAVVRACNNAIEWNSVKVRTIIPGSYEAMRLHVHVAVPNADAVDLDAVAECFPYGTLLPVVVEEGGLCGSSRAGLAADEPAEAHMTVAIACVTVGWGVPVPQDVRATAQAAATAEAASTVEAAMLAAVASEADDAAAEVAEAAVAPDTPADPLKLRAVPTAEEMTPASEAMKARAAAAKAQWAERVLTPYEAFALMADEDEIEVLDVRTSAQRAGHEINGRAGVSVLGARSVPLDDLVSGAAPLPPAGQPVLLVCSRGPKSLVALDYLAACCPLARCVEGGITAWEAQYLPTEEV